MSDLELSNPYDPDAFEHGPRTLPAAPGPRRVRSEAPTPPPPDEAPEEKPGDGPVPWKAAASSVPRLRQQPVSPEPVAAEDAFPGFAQDALSNRGGASFGERHGRMGGADGAADAVEAATPLAIEPPFWELWLERARALPTPVLLGAVVALLSALVLAFVLRPRDEAGVSLAAIRQNPEAYDGRQVAVRGKAGETFSVGGSWVYNLREGRDTIVVYSRTRKPSLHEKVKATGTVSVGYLDGVPRVALFEDAHTP